MELHHGKTNQKMNRIFQGFLGIYFQIGVNVIGIPEVHMHKLSIYKLNVQQNELNIRIGKVSGKTAPRAKEYPHVKRFGKTSKQFGQD